MPLEKRPDRTPLTNEELLQQAEKYFGFARNQYGKDIDGNEYAMTAAQIAQAAASIVIARVMNGQTEMKGEMQLPETEVPGKLESRPREDQPFASDFQERE